jgi:DNA-binding NarL/FixJ family response regulator
MRVLLAIEPTDLRLALELYLSEEPGMTIVGTASEAASLRAVLPATQPDLLILDSNLPGHPIHSLVAEAKNARFQPKVIVLGSDLKAKQGALASGADAYVLTGDAPEQLLSAVRRIRSESSTRQNNVPAQTRGESA